MWQMGLKIVGTGLLIDNPSSNWMLSIIDFIILPSSTCYIHIVYLKTCAVQSTMWQTKRCIVKNEKRQKKSYVEMDNVNNMAAQ